MSCNIFTPLLSQQNCEQYLYKTLKRERIFKQKFDFFVDDALHDKMTGTRTANKKGPSSEVEEIMKKHLELEYDFYNFVKDRFHRLKSELNSRVEA